MIKFRQKNYAIPLAAIVDGAMLAGTGASYFQGKQQQEEMEKANEEQKELIQQQNRQLKKIAEAQKQGAQVDGAALQQTIQKGFAAPIGSILKEGKLFLKDMGNLAMKHRDHLAGGAAVGAAMGAGTYAANKYIQKDMKKEGLTEVMTGQKEYSIGSFAMKTLKNNKKSMLFMGGIGAVPAVLSYQSDKKQIKNQIEDTTAGIPPTQEEKSYSVMDSIAKGFKSFKKAPGKSILSGASWLSMGGGSSGVKNVGQDLVANGKSSWTKKLGGMMLDKNGEASKKGLALSIPVGAGLMAATWDLPQKAVEKATRAVDKDAYAYQDSKNQQI